MLDQWMVTLPALTGEEPRKAYCYCPDDWDTDRGQRYPVLYMFDGHNLFFDEEATYGKSWGLLNYLEETHTPLIVAALECNHHPDNGRLSEYCPYSCQIPGFGAITGRGRETMEYLTQVFKPFIDAHYPTLSDREHTFIGGSSMGGLMSLYAVSRYNHFFSRAAALSPSIRFGPEKLDRLLSSARFQPGTIVYMDYGEAELSRHPGMEKRFLAVSSLLLRGGIALTSRIVPHGEHCEASWERQIPFFMGTLFYDLH